MTVITDLAQETLDRANEALPTDPARRLYVSHGEPPAPIEACDQLTVHLVRMRPKLLQDTQQIARRSGLLSWVASLAVVRFSCVPVLTDGEGDQFDPDPADLTAAHTALMADSTALARHLSRLRAQGQFPESVPNCGDVVWGNVEPAPPQGGHAAYRFTIDVQL